MQQRYSHTSGPSLISIERPHCPKCDERMLLTRLAPGPSGFDIRTFECVGCYHIHIVTVEADPMKFDAVLWLASRDLKQST
jgi:hypothetical protein